MTFTLYQQSKTPIDGILDGTDYISILLEAMEDKKPIEFEVVETVSDWSVGIDNRTQLGEKVLHRHKRKYLVDDVSSTMSSTSGFRMSARVTLMRYIEPVHKEGTLVTKSTNAGLVMTFVDPDKKAEDTKSEHAVYTGECGLAWLWEGIVCRDIKDEDNPANIYPPYAMAGGYYYGARPMRGIATVARGEERGQLRATKTWGDRYLDNTRWLVDRASYYTGRVESALETAASYTYPFISIAARVGAAVVTHGWSEIALLSLGDYPWVKKTATDITTGINGVINYYRNKKKNTANTPSNALGALPSWVTPTFKKGLGFNENDHVLFFARAPPEEVPFELGTIVSMEV